MKSLNIIGATALLSLSLSVQSADIYFGEDLSPGVSSANSAAASALFLSNLSGSVGTEDFESFTDGQAGPFNSNFSGAGTATFSGPVTVSDTVGGVFATSGVNYLRTHNGFVIDFSTAISAFGFFGTDIGDFGGNITLDFLSGGTTQYIVNNTLGTSGSTNGAQLFWGIIDTANPFTKITFGNTDTDDLFGFDDMTIATAAQVNAVPVPAALFMFAPALLGFFGLRRKVNKAA